MKLTKSIALTVLICSNLLQIKNVIGAEPHKVKNGFSNSSKVGLVITTGNSRSQTYDLSQKNNYGWDANKVGFVATYLRATSKGIESARRWSLGLRYDRILAESWSIFVSETIESDTYAGFLQRYNSDLGGKYFLVSDEFNLWFLEGGYRHQYENQKTGTFKSSSFVRVFSEYEHRWNASVSNKVWLEYLQNVANSDDHFFNSEVSIKASLTQVLSIQLAYLLRYRNLPPPGVEFKTDSSLIAAALAHF